MKVKRKHLGSILTIRKGASIHVVDMDGSGGCIKRLQQLGLTEYLQDDKPKKSNSKQSDTNTDGESNDN